MKRLCPTHRFMFEGMECPLCRKDRIDSYVSRYGNESTEHKEKQKKEEDKEITNDDLAKLVAKFNKK